MSLLTSNCVSFCTVSRRRTYGDSVLYALSPFCLFLIINLEA
uniref:Uncharacterized protein MANES_03G116500 n=1 Tax=Rhizophora mucronata TaxID=61149 RepID=A0A2P2KM25_RHIMU